MWACNGAFRYTFIFFKKKLNKSFAFICLPNSGTLHFESKSTSQSKINCMVLNFWLGVFQSKQKFLGFIKKNNYDYSFSEQVEETTASQKF